MSLNQPNFISTVFASGAGAQRTSTIPTTTSDAGKASWTLGFPAETMKLINDGGLPPDGKDMNAILYFLSQIAQYVQAGMLFRYNAAFATAVGGYNQGALILSTDRRTIWKNTVSNNTTDPDSAGASGWEKLTGSFLPLAGGTGSPMSGIIYTRDSTFVRRMADGNSQHTGYISMGGGQTAQTGATITIYGQDHASYPGEAWIETATVNNQKCTLRIKPDGTFTFNGDVPSPATDSTQIATTAYVKDCLPKSVGSNVRPTYTDSSGILRASTLTLNDFLPLDGGTMRGELRVPSEYMVVTSNETGFNDRIHNAYYRGKFLGTSITATQYSAISSGNFTDLYVGDYWTLPVTIDGSTVDVNFRIAGFDLYYMTGDDDNKTQTHHVVLLPDSSLASKQFNSSGSIYGGYVGSQIFSYLHTDILPALVDTFGSDHILTIRQQFPNSVDNNYGFCTNSIWLDESIWLLNEISVYGCRIFGDNCNGNSFCNLYTIDNKQYPLFRFWPVSRRGISFYAWWLRDCVGGNRSGDAENSFAIVSSYGRASWYGASEFVGVRPAFCLKG